MSHGFIALGRGLRCVQPKRLLMSHSNAKAFIKTPSPRQCSRLYSTPGAAPASPRRRSRAIPFLLVGAVLGSTIYYASTPPPKRQFLNDELFVPYTITAREAVSPTSFIFTISPHHPNPSLPYLQPGTSTWRHPQWSVEFKQPEVQIARHYTPLPPLEGEDPADGSLRFYIRAIGGGEMSTYLSRLGVGNDVWLRGPHAGFDTVQRLGNRKDVVFLAGGTGIAPGMQVARAVLDRSADTRVSLLWAIRKRTELQAVKLVPQSPWWKFWMANRATEIDGELEAASPVARQLQEMKAIYGQRLKIQVAIDDERTRFRETDLQKAISSSHSNSLASSSFYDGGCQLHDPRMLEKAPEFEPETPHCQCSGKGSSSPGRNLFIVSGPDGFIEHYAGPKEWQGDSKFRDLSVAWQLNCGERTLTWPKTGLYSNCNSGISIKNTNKPDITQEELKNAYS
ncbi:Cytochrome c mitochondrial import factor CYC2-like protein [Cladobotryum mycophilum]|uniref:Cytochrome c mitochondrial import factor CYC2-like protein n=1 Tax=Cladobotryum mycophilum TaxID=491253 RepID=A0ABR0SPG7_9HYPO